MPDFRKRRNSKLEAARAVLGCVGALVLCALAVVSGRAAWQMYGKFAEADRAHTEAEANLAQLKMQYAQVSAQAASLGSSRGVEAEVRERYGVAKPGEGEIDIVRQAPTSTPAASADQPWWARLWHALFVW